MKRKCAICKKPARFMTPKMKPLCSAECGTELALKEYDKDCDKRFRERKAKFKQNDIQKQKDLTQLAFNKMRRLQCIEWFSNKGIEPECISCGKKNMDWCCGHYKTVGATDNLRFDEKNTHLQCNRYCNMALSGNISGNKNTRGYTQGLHDVYGTDAARSILDYLEVEQHKIKRFTGQELKKLRSEFNKEIRRLEQ